MKSVLRKYIFLNFLFWFSTAMILPIYVLVLTDAGLSLSRVAVAMAMVAIAIFIFEFPSGVFADWFGRKRVYIIANIILSVSMGLLFLFSSYTSVLAGLFLFGTGRAFASGSLEAWFIDAIHENDPGVDTQPYLAKAGVFLLLAIAGGSIVGGLIAQKQLVIGDYNPRKIPLLADAAVKFILAFITGFIIKESKHFESDSKKLNSLIKNLKDFLADAKKDKIITGILTITIFLTIGGSVLEVYWQPHFSKALNLNGKELYLGFIMAGAFILSAAGNMLSIPLGKLFKGRHEYTAFVSHLIYGIVILFLSAVNKGLAGLVVFLLCYGASGMFSSPYSSLYNERLKSEYRSSGISAQSLFSYIGMFAASILGFVAENRSIPAVWMISGLLLTGSSVIILFLYRVKNANMKMVKENDQ